MKKKLFAVLLATVMTVVSAIPAMADGGYVAKFSFASADWGKSVWGDTETTAATFTGEGTYTFSHTFDAEVTGAQVFVIDIEGTDAGTTFADLDLTDVKVKLDGEDLPVDVSKVRVGDLESNGKLRISLYNPNNSNEIGTPADAPFDYNDLVFTSIEITVTLDDPATQPETTPTETEPSETTPTTGDVTAVLPVAVLAVAAMAVVVVMRKKTVNE